MASLLLAACLLAATMAWELGALSARPTADVPHLRVQAIASRATEPDRTPEWVSTMLARPLFSPDRRPALTSVAVATGRATPQELPRLTGVLVGPFGRNALFEAAGGKPLVVTEGGRVDAWIVQSIDVGMVKVRGPGGAMTLQPTFEPSPAAPTGSPPAGQNIGLSPRR
jgi:hypothetical protein